MPPGSQLPGPGDPAGATGKKPKKAPRIVPKAPGPVIPTVPQYLPKVTFGPPIWMNQGGGGGGMAAPTAPDLSKYGAGGGATAGAGGPDFNAPRFVSEGPMGGNKGGPPDSGMAGYMAKNGATIGPDGSVYGAPGEPGQAAAGQPGSSGPLGEYGPGPNSPLVQQTQQAMDDAKKANEDRYKEILAGYGEREKRGQQILSDAEQGALTDIEDSARSAAGSADQNLTSRGLGNTTVRDSTLRGIESARLRSREQARAAIAERRLGTETGLTGDRLQFMERRNDIGPDTQQVQQLYGQMGLAGYGQPAPNPNQPLIKAGPVPARQQDVMAPTAADEEKRKRLAKYGHLLSRMAPTADFPESPIDYRI